MTPSNPDRSLGFLIHDCARLMRRSFIERVTPLDLTQAQWRGLVMLSIHEGINQVTLSELLEVQPITVARLVDKLVANGLVERRPDPNDRRAQLLFLAPGSAPLLEQLWSAADELNEIAFSGLSEAERTTMINMLTKLRSNLTPHAPAGIARASSIRVER
ncbi:MAG: MarR family transcriptional regulator [Rhizobiales bacterium]|nr:MarR family transcriptional regulator [Hyphomicrobiales bacterium]